MGKIIEKYKGIFVTVILAVGLFSTVLGLIQAFGLFDTLNVYYIDSDTLKENATILKNLKIMIGIVPVVIALFVVPSFIKDKKAKTVIQIIAFAIIIGLSVYFMFFLNDSYVIRDYYENVDGTIYYYSNVSAEGWSNQQLAVAAQRQIYAPFFIVAILGIVITAVNDKKGKVETVETK